MHLIGSNELCGMQISNETVRLQLGRFLECEKKCHRFCRCMMSQSTIDGLTYQRNSASSGRQPGEPHTSLRPFMGTFAKFKRPVIRSKHTRSLRKSRAKRG